MHAYATGLTHMASVQCNIQQVANPPEDQCCQPHSHQQKNIVGRSEAARFHI